jgi:hypothetical protein
MGMIVMVVVGLSVHETAAGIRNPLARHHPIKSLQRHADLGSRLFDAV